MLAQDKPNVIFILTDDQSYGYMGCTGNSIVKTPNLDTMASEGVLFENAHITSGICTPSRVSILLSQYERTHGVNFNSGTSVSEEAWNKSYPVVLRKAGYFMEKSFDYWYAGHGHLTFYPKNRHEIFNDAKSNTQTEIINESIDDFLDPNVRNLKGAIRFLEQRPKDKPFLLSINFNLPHGAGTETMKLKPDDDDMYKSLYRDLDIPLPANYKAKRAIKKSKLPADVYKVENRQTIYDYVDTPEELKERFIRQFQAMAGIDRLVGNLRQKLKDLKLNKNTILVFTSDHGLFMGEQGIGGKALFPLIIMDPRLPKHKRNKRNQSLVQTIDIAPTLLSWAGVDIPDSFQGKDISPITKEEAKEVREYVRFRL